MTEISIFRTSFVWVETVPGILAGTVPADAMYRFLGQYGDYAASFDACQADGVAAGDLELPWHSPRGNFFWRHYFEGKHAGEMTGVQAWKKFVPFRVDLDCTTVTTNAESKVYLEAFYFPHGIALVAQATYRGVPKSAREIAALALAVRYDYRFQIDGDGGAAAGFSLDRVAERALALARMRGFGKVEGFPGDNQPFSITTFLVGHDVAKLADSSEEHLLLEAVTGWNRQLKPEDLGKLPLAEAKLPIRGGDDDNVMYGRKNARAIWITRAFASNLNTPTLGCYHRNLTQAGLQALSLGEFVSWVAAQSEAGEAIPAAVKERAIRAASLLKLLQDGKMASGKKVTYRTASVVDQIKRAEWANAITLVQALR